ncbi:hypothetical protein HDU87_005446 [Geranomyces variabilis]|uniref:C2 domain-containing protein n=1 Tax=Geranomyces variabilis TaxID=109894 RepID=A0AAD5TME2_9FUNG|nr:hypothetical protein HDU87_005446 [Geranomyces variabilis]
MKLSVDLVSLVGLKDADCEFGLASRVRRAGPTHQIISTATGNGDVNVRLSTDGTSWQEATVKLGEGHEALVDKNFQFEVDPIPQAKLHIEVYDAKDPGSNNILLGSNHVNLAPIGTMEEVNLTLKKHVVHRHEGTVKLRVGFE